MTLALAGWTQGYAFLACDRRVCIDQGGRRRRKNDDEVKLVTLETEWTGRFVFSYTGLAQVERKPMGTWIYETLRRSDAERISPQEFCSRLAKEASESRAFARLDFVHTFVLAGWTPHGPIGGILHNGSEECGRGHPVKEFRLEKFPNTHCPVIAANGCDTAVTDDDLARLNTVLVDWPRITTTDVDPAVTKVHEVTSHLMRVASKRRESYGAISPDCMSVCIPDDFMKPIMFRSTNANDTLQQIAFPPHLGPGGDGGTVITISTPIPLETVQQRRLSRRAPKEEKNR